MTGTSDERKTQQPFHILYIRDVLSPTSSQLFNHLPLNIKELIHNIKQFRAALSAFLHTKSYYTLDEYFN
jgi:hypothetical protein